MREINLDIEARQELGKAKVKGLRRSGLIPGVVYGEGKKPQSIKIERKTFLRLLKGHHGENIIFHLNILDDSKKEKKPITVITKEIQHDPISEEIIHIDFNQISLTKAIVVRVPILAKGEPVGVKQDGGSLDHLLWDLEVECLPTKIPSSVEVDVSSLKINDAIHIKDLVLPEGVKVLHDPELVVLSVAPPVKEIVTEAVEEVAPTEPEVIKEKKEAPVEEEGKATKEAKEEKKEKTEKPVGKEKQEKPEK